MHVKANDTKSLHSIRCCKLLFFLPLPQHTINAVRPLPQDSGLFCSHHPDREAVEEVRRHSIKRQPVRIVRIYIYAPAPAQQNARAQSTHGQEGRAGRSGGEEENRCLLQHARSFCSDTQTERREKGEERREKREERREKREGRGERRERGLLQILLNSIHDCPKERSGCLCRGVGNGSGVSHRTTPASLEPKKTTSPTPPPPAAGFVKFTPTRVRQCASARM